VSSIISRIERKTGGRPRKPRGASPAGTVIISAYCGPRGGRARWNRAISKCRVVSEQEENAFAITFILKHALEKARRDVAYDRRRRA